MTFQTRLHALRGHEGAQSSRHADQKVTRCIYVSDDDEHPVRLSLPGPRVMALHVVIPAMADGGEEPLRAPDGRLYLRTAAEDEMLLLTLAGLIDRIAKQLTELPEVSGANEPYANVAMLKHVREHDVRSYANSIAEQVRVNAKKFAGPDKVKRKLRGTTPAKVRKAKSRADRREREEMTVRAFLIDFMQFDPPEVITTTELYAAFKERYDDWMACLITPKDIDNWLDGDHEEEGGPECIPALAGKKVFYSVADEVIGPRRRGRGGTTTTYRINAEDEDDDEALTDLVASLPASTATTELRRAV